MSAPLSSRMSLTTATIININAIIGAGVFALPVALQSRVGPAGLLTYLFVVGTVWCLARSFAYLAYQYPEDGSFYNYVRPWGGHVLGMCATICYLSGLVIAMGLLTRIVGHYCASLFPFISAGSWSAVLLVLLIVLHLRGAKLSTWGQRVLVCATLLPLLSITVLCLAHAHISYLFPFMPYGVAPLLFATKSVIFGFFGFECITALSSQVVHPEVTIPRALSYSILFVGVLYFVFTASIILAIPAHQMTNSMQPLTDLLIKQFPHHQWLLRAVAISIISAILGTLHAMMWAACALLTATVRRAGNGMRSLRATWLHEKQALIIIGAAIGIAAYALTNVDLFFSITALLVVPAYILSLMTLLVQFKSLPSRLKAIVIIGFCAALFIAYCALYSLVAVLA
jgi:amino acid transporter